MGRLTRSYDWITTALGNPDTWPQSLKTTLGIVLNSRFPMFLFWGEELLCFYNDAYRPSLGNDGKHPNALGKPAFEIWPEIWAIINPLLKQVMAGGEATWSEDMLVPIYRNGKIEDVYWTFSYSPVFDETGKPAGVLTTCMDTTEKVYTLNRLADSKDQLQFAIEAAELGTWDYSPVTNKFTANARLREWFGLPPEVNIPLSVSINAIAEADKERVKKAIERGLIYESGGQYDLEYTIIHPLTKQERVVHAKGKAWFDENKTAYRLSGTLQDITESKEAEQTLKESESRYRTLAAQLERQVQERTEELETINEELSVTNEELSSSNAELVKANDRFHRSNQSLEQFAYVASHDLQEPLRKIQSFGDLLKRQYEEQLGEGVEYLHRMQSGASRMSVLIKDLLTFSRISNRQETMDVVSLADTLETVLNDLELIISETNATIHTGVLPSVQGDVTQLGQLFQNLLSNALKFRQEGVPPVIQINTQLMMASDLPADIKPARWSLAYHRIGVSDNGIGFDTKYADRIFQVFQRLHGKSSYSGTGIGLAICEKVASNHGGTITVVSQPGQGSTFSVYLPV